MRQNPQTAAARGIDQRFLNATVPARRRALHALAACALLRALDSRAQEKPQAGDFERAIVGNNARAMTLLMLRGFDPNTRNAKGQPGLVAALHRDALQVVDILLISPGVQVDLASPQGETALMLACIKGHLPLVQELLRRGSAVNRAGWTPLHYAASASHEHTRTIVQVLLRAGAHVNAASPNGSTALMLAAQYSSEDVVHDLLRAGADITLRNQRNLDAVDFARRSDRRYLVEQLVKIRRQAQGKKTAP